MRRFVTWKWLLRVGLALFVFVVATPLIYHFVVRTLGQRELETVVARLDAEDPGWRWADIAHETNAKRPPDERNPFVLASSASKLLPGGPASWVKGLPEWRKYPPNVALDETSGAKLDIAFGSCEPAAKLARGLADLPEVGGEPVDPLTPATARLPPWALLSGLAIALRANAEVAARARRDGEAIRCVRASLGILRAIDDEPTAVGQILRIQHCRHVVLMAERILNLTDGDEGLAELQTEFAGESVVPSLNLAARGERGQVPDVDFQLQRFAPPGVTGGKLGEWAVRRHSRADAVVALDLLTRCVEVGRMPVGQRAAAVRQLPSPPVHKELYPITFWLVPNVCRVAQDSVLSSGELTAVAAGIACERHRRRFGTWPAALADIPKDILTAVPTDPCDGKPIKYQRLPGRVVVYSVGPDGTDHGGDLGESTPKEKRDYGIRLYDVALRRQPAPAIPDLPDAPPGVP